MSLSPLIIQSSQLGYPCGREVQVVRHHYLCQMRKSCAGDCQAELNQAADGLLTQSAEAVQLTWMDALVEAEAPFTPRGCVAQAWSVAEFVAGDREAGDG